MNQSAATNDAATLYLTPPEFRALPLGAIKPGGWLTDQLQLQADGLSGHLDEFWPSIADSQWMGGKSDGWERGPYWLDGLIPLAVLLNDDRLKAKATRWIDYILAHQSPDGWLGPVQKDRDGVECYDTWPLFVLFKAMSQYAEATSDNRIVPAMLRAMRFIHQHIISHPIFDWGKYRTADLVVSIYWLHDQTAGKENWLLEMAALVEKQGFDWRALYERDYSHKEKTADLQRCQGAITSSHGPNAAMGLKQPALRYRLRHEQSDRDAILHMIETLDLYHGQASGVFSCDEHLAGRMPSQGTELCAVVEYLFSLETSITIAGEQLGTFLADRLERIAFNALPAPFKPDMWAHQYDQQANQVVAKLAPDPIYTDNGPDSNLYGLEPHFGCCTANFHQGWPKFVSHLWMSTPGDGGLVAVAYAPCTVATKINDTTVRIEVKTDYPFDEVITVIVCVEEPARFPLRLRIPAWTSNAVVNIDGTTSSAQSGTYYKIDREWGEETVIELRLPMSARAVQRFNGAVAIERGPLVYSLAVAEDWQYLKGELPHADWQVFPASTWNVAIQLDPQKPADDFMRFERSAISKIYPVFSAAGTPIRAIAKGRELPGWTVDRGAAMPPPVSPVTATGPLRDIELIPFGAAKLRLTEIPWEKPAPQ